MVEHLSRKGLTNRYEDKADELMAEVVKLSSTVTSKKITKYEREYHAMKQVSIAKRLHLVPKGNIINVTCGDYEYRIGTR